MSQGALGQVWGPRIEAEISEGQQGSTSTQCMYECACASEFGELEVLGCVCVHPGSCDLQS